MIARFTGGIMGLLGFGVAALAGALAGNPFDVVLVRALWSLAIFCVIGLAVGAAAQAVINEYALKRAEALATTDNDTSQAEAPDGNSIPAAPEPMGTE